MINYCQFGKTVELLSSKEYDNIKYPSTEEPRNPGGGRHSLERKAVMRTYCICRCLSIRHYGGTDPDRAHSHTIEITADIRTAEERFEPFFGLEGYLNEYFAPYENQLLNSLPEFQGDASIEGMGEVFFRGLAKSLEKRGLRLERLKVGETPLRRYIVGWRE